MAHIYLVVFRFPNLFTESVKGKRAAVYKTSEKDAKHMHVIQQKMELKNNDKLAIFKAIWPQDHEVIFRLKSVKL